MKNKKELTYILNAVKFITHKKQLRMYMKSIFISYLI